MQRLVVDSSSVASIGYDADERVLEVEFHNGRVYQYFDVAEQTHLELVAAESIGAFINNVIKPSYRFKPV